MKLGYTQGVEVLKIEVHECWDCAVLGSQIQPHDWVHFWEIGYRASFKCWGRFAFFNTLNVGEMVIRACHAKNCNLFLCIFVHVLIYFRDSCY